MKIQSLQKCMRGGKWAHLRQIWASTLLKLWSHLVEIVISIEIQQVDKTLTLWVYLKEGEEVVGGKLVGKEEIVASGGQWCEESSFQFAFFLPLHQAGRAMEHHPLVLVDFAQEQPVHNQGEIFGIICEKREG